MTSETGDQAHDNFACFVHERVSSAIGLMDAKASIILGLASGAIIYLAREAQVIETWLDAPNWARSLDITPQQGVTLTASLLLTLSFLLAVSCVWPRTGKPKTGLVFFQTIAGYPSASDYAGAVAATSSPDLIAAVLADAHAVSHIAKRKMALVAWATRLLVAGVLLTISAEFLAHV